MNRLGAFRILLLLTLLVTSSCELFTSKEVTIEKLVQQELQSLNRNEVDQYPLFSNCDETASKEEQKKCFENTILDHLSNTLEEYEFILEGAIQDTIDIDFLIDNTGKLTLLTIEKNAKVKSQIPEFNGIIRQCISRLPKVAPALKKGIPVSAKFRIPLVLNSK